MPDPVSPRLLYRRLTAADTEAFHALATDPHVRRYLLDGQVVPRAWAEAEVAGSDALFDERGVGLWLVREAPDAPFVGFVGFRRFEELGPEPQLLYAFAAGATGRGYATEAGRALLALVTGWPKVVSAVDAPNTASLRVLAKLGFVRTGTAPGAFGDIIFLARRP